MLRSAKEHQGLTVHASDGDIGKVDDLYFDDDAWTIRYFIVNTGKWLAGRRVLVSPVAIKQQDGDWERMNVSLTCDQIKNSPDIDTAQPVSRQMEQELFRHYGWPIYWGVEATGSGVGIPGELTGMPGAEPSAADLTPEEDRSTNPSVPIERESGNSHLQSMREVFGYRIQARDGDMGHLQDFLIDDQTWRINYIVVDTSNLWFGKKVILPPTWVRQVSWAERQAVVDLKRETIKNSPEFDSQTINKPS